MSINKWLELVDIILPNVKTDLDKDEIYSYLMAIVKMGTTELKQYSLPIQNGYTSQKINGEDCLVPDLEKNKKALKKYIFEE